MGLNLNLNIQTDWGTGGTQGTSGTGGTEGTTPGTTFGDNVVSLGGLNITFNYTNGSGHPALPPPNENPSTQLPPQWGSDVRTPVHEHAYYESFASHLENLAAQYGLSPQQVNNLIFHHMSGTVPDDTFLNDVLNELEGKVAEEMLETFGEDAFPNVRDQARALKNSGQAAVDSSRAQLDQLQEYVDSLPEGPEKQKLQEFINQARSNLDNIQNSLNQLDSTSDRGELGNTLSQLQGQLEDLKEHLGTANSLTNDPNVGSVLANVTNSINNATGVFSDQISTADQNNQLAQGNWSLINTEVGKTFMGLLETSFGASFEEALNQYAAEHGLSPEQVAQLRFAHFNPDLVTDPNIKAMLGDINTIALSMMSENWGIPPGYVPNANNTQFNAEVEYAYDEAFQQLLEGTDLQALAQQLGMSEADVKGMLEFLHFNKELASELMADTDQMKALLGIDDEEQFQALLDKLAELEDGALQQISQQYGLPPGFKPNASSHNYNAKNQGEFLRKFDYNMRNQQPPLTEQQIADIRAALNDPLNPNISAETKALISQIYNQTVTEMRAEYNLPVGWAPPITQLSSLGNVSPHIRAVWSGIEQIEEELQIMATFVDAMPDSPAKALLLNVMKIISEAISRLKEQIAQIQILDSQLASKISEAQKEASLWKIELEKRKIEEARKKKAKLKPLMNFMKIFGPIMKVFMMLLFMCMPPMGWVIAASMMQDLATGGKQNFLTDMFEKIMDSLPSPANIFVSLAVMGALAMCGGLFTTLEIFFTNSGIMQEILLAMGADEMTAEIVTMCTQMAIEIIIMIILTIVTGGAGAGLLVAHITAKVAQVTAKALQFIARVLQTLMRVAEKSAKIADKIQKVLNKVQKLIQKLQDYARKMEKLASKLQKASKKLDTAKKNLDKAKKAGDQDEIAKWSGKVEKYQGQVDKYTEKIMDMEKAIDRVIKGVEYTKVGVDAATSGVQAAASFIQADLARILARFDAEIEALEALIKILKKLLDSIFKAMESQGAWMVELGNLQQNMWSDASATATAVAGANEA